MANHIFQTFFHAMFFLNKKDERFSENLMRSTPESVFVHLQAEAIEIYCSLFEA